VVPASQELILLAFFLFSREDIGGGVLLFADCSPSFFASLSLLTLSFRASAVHSSFADDLLHSTFTTFFLDRCARIRFFSTEDHHPFRSPTSSIITVSISSWPPLDKWDGSFLSGH